MRYLNIRDATQRRAAISIQTLVGESAERNPRTRTSISLLSLQRIVPEQVMPQRTATHRLPIANFCSVETACVRSGNRRWRARYCGNFDSLRSVWARRSGQNTLATIRLGDQAGGMGDTMSDKSKGNSFSKFMSEHSLSAVGVLVMALLSAGGYFVTKIETLNDKISASTSESTKQHAQFSEKMLTAHATLSSDAVRAKSELLTEVRLVQQHSQELDRRLTRLSSAMPNFKGRIARAELAQPVDAALIVSDPYTSASGEQLKTVTIADFQKHTATTASVPAKLSLDPVTAGMFSGTPATPNANIASFLRFDGYLKESRQKLSSPELLDQVNSYVVRHVGSLGGPQAADEMKQRLVMLKSDARVVSLEPSLPSKYSDVLKRFEKGGELRFVTVPATTGVEAILKRE